MSHSQLPIWITIDGFEPNEELKTFLSDVAPYGIILFARHLKSDEQVKSLIDFMRKESRFPLRVALDQEGGRVSRLKTIGYEFKGASECSKDPSEVRTVASEMAKVLSELGFDVDFAPVVDLGPAEPGTGLEGRVYSPDKKVVTRCAQAFLDGLSDFGIAGCLKHFPGLGGSKVDSHKNLPVIYGDSSEREIHLYPYRNLTAEFVMVAHSSYQFLEDQAPSTINREIYGLLHEIGFRGKIVTDDLKMGALSGFGTLEDLVRKSLDCGAHIALFVSPEEETKKVADFLRK